jgi:hypothetical protein
VAARRDQRVGVASGLGVVCPPLALDRLQTCMVSPSLRYWYLNGPCHGASRGCRTAAPAADAQQAFYAGGDEAPVRALLTDDVHWHVPGRNAIAGTYQGIEAVLGYFRRRRDLVDRTFRMPDTQAGRR